MIKRILLMVAFIYLTMLLLLFVFQRDIMYHQKKYGVEAARLTLHDFIEVELKAEDDVKVFGWLKETDPNNPVIIYFHGNAESIADDGNILRQLSAAGYNVFGMEYRGYGHSEDNTTEEGIFNDARASIDYLRKRYPEDNIILFGRSLGTGVALKMATEYTTRGVILQSPYTSIEEIADNQYPYFPIKKLGLLKDTYDSRSLLERVDEPVLVFHGRKDTLIPISNSEEIISLLHSPSQLVVFDDADHINGFDPERMVDAITKFFGTAP